MWIFLLLFWGGNSQDSIPSWQLVYSKVYHQQFVSENVDFDYSLLQKENSVFHQLVYKDFDSALDIIPLYTGIKWKKNYHIDIYPTRSIISFSHPLTLAYNPNQLFMFFTLIHETVHHNLSLQFSSDELSEIMSDKVASKVSKIISDKLFGVRRFSKYYEYHNLYSWDLDSLSIREWWNINKKEYMLINSKFKNFEKELFHQNLVSARKIFNEIQNSTAIYYKEKSFLKLIAYYEKKSQGFAIKYCEKYQLAIPNGVFKNFILFKHANLLLKSGKKIEALDILALLRKSGPKINNYLDDSYLLAGRISSGAENVSSASSQFLYIIDHLPSKASKASAYQNLARIYKRLGSLKLSAKAYNLAFKNMKCHDCLAQLIIEMEQVKEEFRKINFKEKIIKVLQYPIKQRLKEQIEKIYKSLL